MSRRFPTHTPLGHRVSALGYTAADFAAVTNIHPRTLTDYLAGRKPMLPHHQIAAASVLGCEPADLDYP